MLNRAGYPQTATKQANTRDFLHKSHGRNSVLCLPVRREPTRSRHNLLHRPEELRYGNRSEFLASRHRAPSLTAGLPRSLDRNGPGR